ncbi:hypothetical protein ABRT01_07530 [Lentibacillus sp. L22]|uniref:hypothetical protein n=1 Tax=Lentibacillus TaxID=175304 RepID=UPI0022B1A507|nr:hypothetical protein [Lentibacillus daqui]
MRLLIEIMGWILAAIGAYYISEENTMVIHYILLIVGIVILLMTLPFKSYRYKKR